MARARTVATPQQLKMSKSQGTCLADRLVSCINDPAYIHEIEAVAGPATRKQYEVALRKLLKLGMIVRYGQKTRRLYASARFVHDALTGVDAEAIRLLQFFPSRGALLSTTLERGFATRTGHLSHAKSHIEKLEKAGFVRVAPTFPRVILLTSLGEVVRRTLGSGLAYPPVNLDTAQPLFLQGQAGIIRALRGRSLRTSEIARVLDWNAGVTSTAVHRAEERGYVSKVHDTWYLTSAGRRFAEAAEAVENEIVVEQKLSSLAA